MGYEATRPNCRPPVNLPRALNWWGPPGGGGYVATRPTYGPPVVLAPALKRWGTLGGRGYVATWATCGPPLIPASDLKQWGPWRRHGLCSRPAHLWATLDSTACFEAVEIPPDGRGYVATRPTCGLPLLLPPTLKQLAPPEWQGLCFHPAHLWGTSHSAPSSIVVVIHQAAGVMWPPGPLLGHLLYSAP